MKTLLRPIHIQIFLFIVLQFVLVLTYEGLTNITASAGITFGNIVDTEKVFEPANNRMDVKITGFSSQDDTCDQYQTTDCLVGVHFDVSSTQDEGQIRLYASGPAYDNQMIGEITLREKVAFNIKEYLKTDHPGFYTVTAVALNSDFEIASSSSSSFYSKPSTGITDLSTKLATLDMPDTTNSEPKSSVQAIQSPAPSNKNSVSQPINTSSSENKVDTPKPSPSATDTKSVAPAPTFTFKKSEEVTKKPVVQESAPQPEQSVERQETPQTQNNSNTPPAPVAEERRVVDPNDKDFRLTWGYSLECVTTPGRGLTRKAKELFATTVCYEVKK